MATLTYAQFIAKPTSEKIVLAHVEPTQRLLLWTVDTGAIYNRDVSHYVIDLLSATTSLTEVTTSSLNAGEWFFDAENLKLWVRMSDDSNPQASYMVAKYRLFFSDAPYTLTHDLSVTGDEVIYEPLIKSTSKFSYGVDSAEQQGISIESSGSIVFNNLHAFFDPLFDKLVFENKDVKIYSWSPLITFDKAQIIYKGEIQDKRFKDTDVSFKLKDFVHKLRQPVNLNLFSSSDGTISDSVVGTTKRVLYGKVSGVDLQTIDMIVDGFTLTGTCAFVDTSASVTGTGTAFLDECAAGDVLKYNDVNGSEISFSIKTVANDTSLTLSEVATDTQATATTKNLPERPWRKKNRTWFIADHKLRAPATTLSTDQTQLNRIDVVSTLDLEVGDTIKVNSISAIIKRISANIITLRQNLSSIQSSGATVTKEPILAAYYNKTLLAIDRDYTTTNTTSSKLVLTNTVEFNIARPKAVIGTSVTFKNANRAVTGIATLFTQQVGPRDWIRSDDVGHTSWYEILEVTDDTNLVIRTNYGGTNTTGDGEFKMPVLIGDDSIVSVNCLGKEVSSAWVKTASDVVKDLLNDAGVTDIDTAEFVVADGDAPQTIALKIPLDKGSTPPTVRDMISLVNQSVLGSLVSTIAQQATYRILTPKTPPTMKIITDDDVLKFSVQSKTDIFKKYTARYAHFDTDKFNPGESGSSSVNHTSTFVSNLIGTTKEQDIDLYLANTSEAQIMTERYSFYHSLSQSVIKISAKLDYAQNVVGDIIQLDLDRLYQRFGDVTTRRKVGIISKVTKNGASVDLEISDLGNIWNRVCNIAANTSLVFGSADQNEKMLNGYIVDTSLEVPDTSSEKEWGTNLLG